MGRVPSLLTLAVRNIGLSNIKDLAEKYHQYHDIHQKYSDDLAIAKKYHLYILYALGCKKKIQKPLFKAVCTLFTVPDKSRVKFEMAVDLHCDSPYENYEDSDCSCFTDHNDIYKHVSYIFRPKLKLGRVVYMVTPMFRDDVPINNLDQFGFDYHDGKATGQLNSDLSFHKFIQKLEKNRPDNYSVEIIQKIRYKSGRIGSKHIWSWDSSPEKEIYGK